jgi:molybdopterin/thiamine biosynthesis adenylyltransferase/rhodanese-related sulfurtransferase
VREQDEYVQGYIPARAGSRAATSSSASRTRCPNATGRVILYCASGNRSALAARSLNELGYTNVKSLTGGFTAWKRAGLHFDLPVVLDKEQQIRYSRHTMLPEVGEAGQIKLLKSRVLLLGAGGLGAPSSMYLAAAGVGTLGMVDDDVVDLSNLQRQIVHAQERIGMPKVESAAQTLKGINPDVKVVPHKMRLTSDNIMSILADYDLVVDGADNFPTRYLLNDAALKLGKPVIHASIYRFEGQLTAFIPDAGPCYRCLYPSPPPADMAPSCQEAGVLGVLPGVVGVLQANEAIKVLLGIGTSLAGPAAHLRRAQDQVPRAQAPPRPRVPHLRRRRRSLEDRAHRLRAVLRRRITSRVRDRGHRRAVRRARGGPAAHVGGARPPRPRR